MVCSSIILLWITCMPMLVVCGEDEKQKGCNVRSSSIISVFFSVFFLVLLLLLRLLIPSSFTSFSVVVVVVLHPRDFFRTFSSSSCSWLSSSSRLVDQGPVFLLLLLNFVVFLFVVVAVDSAGLLVADFVFEDGVVSSLQPIHVLYCQVLSVVDLPWTCLGLTHVTLHSCTSSSQPTTPRLHKFHSSLLLLMNHQHCCFRCCHYRQNP
mmetsp:Transcript_27135/g.64894  ORF Transcript_27135/g.64894 Transcript_27135/m.64894 type:complete len:208 (+) Transcript_27135:3140-3763(+)